jgi:GT2 family glycosyltransferase
MELSFIIVNYRSRQKAEVCIDSIIKSAEGRLDYEIILVENASGEDLSALAARSPRIKLIVSEENRGMGGGNNIGLAAAAGEYAFILNPDTIIQGDAPVVLLDYLKSHPEAGIVGPKLLNTDGSLQYSCARFPGFFMPILRRTFLGKYFSRIRDRFQMLDFDHDSPRRVGWLMGSALMFRRKYILPAGECFQPRFDERYFMYFEDVDICRSSWKKGLAVVYLPEAVLIHDHARASARHPWYVAFFRDRLTRTHVCSWLKYTVKWGFKAPTYGD